MFLAEFLIKEVVLVWPLRHDMPLPKSAPFSTLVHSAQFSCKEQSCKRCKRFACERSGNL